MKKSLFFLLALVATLVVFNACKKDEAQNADVTTSEDLATAQDFSDQTDIDIDIAIEERGGNQDCPVVTLANPWGTWPNTITIDYGDGCTRPDGRVLKGKIIVTQTAEIFSAGAQRTVTHENFFVDDVKVEGTRIWVNNGLNANGQWSYTKTSTGMKLTFPDGDAATWAGTHTTTLIEGGNTLTHWDNVWSTTGSASGVNRNGQNWTATITEPIIKRANCRWISDGVIQFTRDGNTATLNFGNGTCDRFATLTLPNGDVITIRLRR